MEKKIKKVRIIINPVAGKEESVLSIVDTAMKEVGIKWEVSITHKAGDAIQIAKDAVKEGVDALAVYGGDGTIAEAINGLVGSDLSMIILPGGSANVMAAELGIPIDLKEACALMSKGLLEIKKIDAGQFNKRYFIMGISLGFQSDVIKGASRESKNKFGFLAYLFSAFAAVKKTRKATYNIKIDGQEHEVEGLMCIITNTGNLGFGKLSFDKPIDTSDGLLDVVVVRQVNFSMFKLIATKLLKSKHTDNFELVNHWQGKDISVSSSPKQTVQCDGEVLGEMPLHIHVIPGAIKVLVPKKVTKGSA